MQLHPIGRNQHTALSIQFLALYSKCMIYSWEIFITVINNNQRPMVRLEDPLAAMHYLPPNLLTPYLLQRDKLPIWSIFQMLKCNCMHHLAKLDQGGIRFIAHIWERFHLIKYITCQSWYNVCCLRQIHSQLKAVHPFAECYKSAKREENVTSSLAVVNKW